MMPVPQSESADINPHKLHRPFRFYDPEAVAVLTILLGLFQVLLGIPVYYMSIRIHVLYMCPVFVGAVYVAGGTYAMACERSPSRQLLKHCLYSGIGALVLGLCAIVVYGYAVHDIKHFELCNSEQSVTSSITDCPTYVFVGFFRAIAALLFLYDISALILQCFISFSAMKGLKNN
ncbi:uncharacterized protein LOC143477063 [Brachyhypopomus gauderio]|uniref:uncharacterized protein LOC143477063 n=1 Tax=Brachyhypopomus gauderio TaxID=698409 RepID=UPI004041ED2F